MLSPGDLSRSCWSGRPFRSRESSIRKSEGNRISLPFGAMTATVTSPFMTPSTSPPVSADIRNVRLWRDGLTAPLYIRGQKTKLSGATTVEAGIAIRRITRQARLRRAVAGSRSTPIPSPFEARWGIEPPSENLTNDEKSRRDDRRKPAGVSAIRVVEIKKKRRAATVECAESYPSLCSHSSPDDRIAGREQNLAR